MIRRVAALLAAGLLLCACGTVSASKAMSGWVKQSGFTNNATSLYQDVKNSVKDLKNLSLTSNDLHTLCNVLFVDDGSMQSSLPTPDSQATHLLNTAYRDFATAAVECYSANVLPADRTKALAMLRSGAAAFSEARARVKAIGS
ncbi:MAG TPA: hypothetical protein VMU68_08815 [Acidimicrobiales bacterium]|nr:hypothetical protein [Acidimicrobiales bacterium]